MASTKKTQTDSVQKQLPMLNIYTFNILIKGYTKETLYELPFNLAY